AIALFASGRVHRYQRLTGLVKQQAGQKAGIGLAGLPETFKVVCQLLLDPVPYVPADDRGMVAGIALVLMRDVACINGIAQDRIKLTTGEGTAAVSSSSAGCPAGHGDLVVDQGIGD